MRLRVDQNVSVTRRARRLGRAVRGLIALLVIVSAAHATLSWAAGMSRPPRVQPTTQPAEETDKKIHGAAVLKKIYTSPRYKIDGIYRSMKGPQSYGPVIVGEADRANELLWITAHYTEIVEGDEGQLASPEFMCHSNLSITNPKQYSEVFGTEPRQRLFTLSQGQMDVRFPDGFGIPVMAHQVLRLETQVLNLNPQSTDLNVRHRGTFEYVRQSDLEEPMKPLLVLNAQGMVATTTQALYYGEADPTEEEHGPGCSVGRPAGARGVLGPEGGKFAAHWVVEPGRSENRTLATNWMQVPFDTTVHFIAVHLHPFAESASLFDLTNNELVFRSAATGPEDRIGLTHVESFSSKKGLPLHRAHEYEISSVYENTSGVNQDSMAVMFIYVLDKNFSLPPQKTAR